MRLVNKEKSASHYDPRIDYNNDNLVFLGLMSNECEFCTALKWKESKRLCYPQGEVCL